MENKEIQQVAVFHKTYKEGGEWREQEIPILNKGDDYYFYYDGLSRYFGSKEECLSFLEGVVYAEEQKVEKYWLPKQMGMRGRFETQLKEGLSEVVLNYLTEHPLILQGLAEVLYKQIDEDIVKYVLDYNSNCEIEDIPEIWREYIEASVGEDWNVLIEPKYYLEDKLDKAREEGYKEGFEDGLQDVRKIEREK